MLLLWRKLSRKLKSKPVLVLTTLIGALITLLVFSPGHKETVTNTNHEHNTPAAETSKTEPDVNEAKPLKLRKASHSERQIKSANGLHINPYPFEFTILPQSCMDEQLVIVVHSAINVGYQLCLFCFIYFFPDTS